MRKKRNFLILSILCLFSVMAYCNDFPSVRYVSSKEGLNKRELPSISSKKIGVLLYGSRVIVVEKGAAKETIDGITDYWYRCQGREIAWVFGGYLANRIPDDTISIIGYWDTDRGEKYYWNFNPDYTVSSGKKETDVDWRGNWALCDNKLTIITTPTEFTKNESDMMEIMVTVVNRDQIILVFSNGTKEVLKRNNDII